MQTDNAKIQEQKWSDISVKDLQTALKQSQKSAGIEQVSHYWLSALYKGYYIRDTVKNPKYSPAWLSEGITYLLPKTNDAVNPKNCRPITWLSTTYKLPTSPRECMYSWRLMIYSLLNKNDAEENPMSKKDHLLINRMIIED